MARASRTQSKKQAARRRPVYRRGGSATYARSARYRLRRFRTGSTLAVAITAILLLLWGNPGAGQEQVDTIATGATILVDTTGTAQTADTAQADTAALRNGPLAEDAADEASRSVQEARRTIRDLTVAFMGLLPKLVIGLMILLVAGFLARLIRPALRRAFGSWEKADAVSTLFGISIWFLALATTLSVLAGSPGALLGSIGLVGLALSWALQAPIESFTAWLLNSFRGHYRVGDRIAVGDVFGDVYTIDFLTTTLWEAGGPDKPVQGSQPTGALITFPNSELLRSNIINYTRGFPYVWDELAIGVANESDLEYAMQVIVGAARRVVGDAMRSPVQMYRGMLEATGLGDDIAEEPQVYLSTTDSWSNITIRYLVPARERRRWASAILLEVSKTIAAPEHKGRIRAAYPVQRIDLEGTPR